MIGRIRAAWDDSRRAANTRRGSNPMSREEWFELQDRITNLITGESLSIHLTDYRRHIERCIESQFRLHEARTRSDEPLTRSDVEAIAVNAAGDLIGKAFLGSTSPTAPDTNSRTVTGVLHTDDGDGVGREWNPETYERNATRRTGMTPILGDGPITRAEATAIGAEIKDKLDELLAAKCAGVLPGLASSGGVWRSAGSELDHERSARADEENDVAQVASDCVGHGLSGADDLSGGIDDVVCSVNRYLERLIADMDDRAGGVRHRHFDARTCHSDSSPSVGDAGAHSVGEGSVAGVETTAPVIDATDCGSDAGCAAQVMLAGHVIDLTLEQNAVFGTLTVTVHLPDGPIWRTLVHPSLRNGDGKQIFPTDDLPVGERLSDQREGFRASCVGSLEGSAGLVGRSTATSTAATPDELIVGPLVVDQSEPGGLHHGTGGHSGPDSGDRKDADECVPQGDRNDDVSVSTRPDEHLVGVGDEDGLELGRRRNGPVGHSASPSIDGGHRTVGEGSVAGVETAAPVTDATDVFAGPGLFRYDGSQAHAAEHAAADEAATWQAMTRQIGDYLAELHRQGESWHQMARLILHVFELRQTP
ncbi:hypothetical protein BS297_17675 [Rhodococcus erythropolis]|uniref:Uncharacterized protein n=1 Tax=Rhodococcus erythropolis TaxID=1833 RepID=A0A0C3AE21_RHOER|nr:hypothetical protein BS297_17675 [Rhodococcus erythropolis]KIM17551.1 hypothetical protein QV65_04185 [Rhodococcus erythropolis]